MRAALGFLGVLTLSGCLQAGPTGGAAAPAASDPLANLPEGVTRDMVYTRQPDPRAGPCYYYRVEGFEVLLSCIG